MSQTRYTADHEWARLEGGIVTIGITNHAQQALGDLVFVELPTPGQVVAAGAACAVVESVKAASDVFAPLAGRVVAVNDALTTDPGLVNRDAEEEGWFFQMEPADPAAFARLLDADAYAALVEEAG